MEEEQVLPQAGGPHVLDIGFTGAGNEYFRIWIVNLLLTIVSIGFYYPWAKVRRLRYFYGNTLVGGHALDFHGDPKAMLRGFLLVGAMVLLYSVAGRLSPAAGLIAFLIVGGAFPALLCAAFRFRLANTSWRGLRLRFTGTIGGVYRVMLLPVLPVALMLWLATQVGPAENPDLRIVTAYLVLLLVIVALIPLFTWMLRKYQHDNYALGQERTQLAVGPGAFYLVNFKTSGLGVLAIVVIGGLAAAVSYLSHLSGSWPYVMILIVYVAMFGIVWPYFVSRMQNLLWSNTASERIRFRSTLRAMPLIGLTLKNALLVIVTLGFYWPYAAIALAKMRLEAVAVQMDVSPDELSAARQPSDDASGDAAGDLLGIDIGF